MAPTVEIIRAIKSEKFKAEGIESIRAVLDIVDKADGHIATYYGTEVQDSEVWYAVILWESMAAHQTLKENKDLYPKVLKSFNEGAAKLDFVYHSILSTESPQTAFEAPLTEIAFWTLREGADKKEFDAILSELVERALASKGVDGRGGFGTTLEDERKIAVTFGWNSMEKFNAGVAATPWLDGYISRLKALGDIDLKHVVLTKNAA